MRLALIPGYASRRSFDPVEPKVHRFSFRQATLGLGQLVRLFHSSLSFRTPEAWLPDLRDFHPRLRTSSPSAPAFQLFSFSLVGQTPRDMNQNPNRRKMRWWIPLTLIVLAGGAAAYCWFREVTFVEPILIGIGLLTAILLGLWYIFFTGLPWRTRGILVLIAAGFVAGLYFGVKKLTRVEGSIGGSGIPRLVWKWAPKQDGSVGPLVLVAETAASNSACCNGPVAGRRLSPVSRAGPLRGAQRHSAEPRLGCLAAQNPLASAYRPGLVRLRRVWTTCRHPGTTA